jgi:DNA-binding transcriptional LysR family regulator
MKLEGILAFAAVVDEGSVSGAGRRLNISKSVVSERLAELERSLGAHLLQRTTRAIHLTADGRTFLERARRILAEAAQARTELAEQRGALAGPLRISAPVSFGVLHLGHALNPFLLANPGIQLTLELEDRFVDVAAGGFDAVIRHGPIRDERVVARRIASIDRHLVASPAYLKAHGTPKSVKDLETHTAILYAHREADWRFTVGRRAVVVRPRASHRLNNGILMRDAAVAGVGIALLPDFIAGPETARKQLRIVDVGARADGADLFVAYPTALGSSAKVRALVDVLRATFGDKRNW